jgi:D-alanine--D-alanine ligase
MSAHSDAVRAEPALVPGTRLIGVLMGGRSRERPVSLQSGRSVVEALRDLGHTVRPADVTPESLTRESLRGIDVAFLALHGEWGEDGQIQAELERLGVAYTFSGPEASRLAMDKQLAKERFFRQGVLTPPFRVVRHGDSRTLRDAFIACELTEKTARTYLVALAAGKVNLLPPSALEADQSLYHSLQSGG